MISTAELQKLKLFQNASRASLERLSREMEEKSAAPGEVIIAEGSIGGALYVLVSGSATVRKESAGSAEGTKTIARLEPEEVFGELSFLEDIPHSASVVAQETSRFFVLPRESMIALMEADPRAALDPVLTLMNGVGGRLRRTTTELVSIFEVAQLIAKALEVPALAKSVLRRIHSDVGGDTSIGFYRWNPFNEEYALVEAVGEARFPAVMESNTPLVASVTEPMRRWPDAAASQRDLSPLAVSGGDVVAALSGMPGDREGMFLFVAPVAGTFDAGHRQLMESVAALMTPALASARSREEEAARKTFEKSRMERYPL